MFLTNTISYLSRRPGINLLLVFCYYLLVVLPHEQVGKFCAWLFDGHMTRNDYNGFILLLSIAGLLGYLYVLWKNAGQQPGLRRLVAGYLFFTILFAVACFKLLIVINIEVVHFVQYGVMAFLLFPLVKKYGETVSWAMLLGAADEAWQYFYLAPQRTNYYDFNDVIINLIGAGFGLILIRALDPAFKNPPKRAYYRSPVFFTFAGLGAFIFLAFKLNWLKMGPLPEGEDPFWTLIRVPPTGFWTTVHPDVTFHVIQPAEGVVLIVVLLLFYAGLDLSKTDTSLYN